MVEPKVDDIVDDDGIIDDDTIDDNLDDVTDDDISASPEGEDDPPVDTVDDEGAEPSGDDPPADPPPKKKGGVQRKIDKLTKRASKAELDAQYWKGVAEGQSMAAPGTTDDSVPELNRDDFDTEEEYIDARVDQRMKVHEKKTVDTTAQDRFNTVQKQYADAREKYDDFDEIALSHDHPVNAPMIEAAMGDNLTEILYYLGKNHDISIKISQMTPTQAIKEIGKIEDKIMNPKPKSKLKPKPSKAPEPVPTLKSGSEDPGAGGGEETQAQRMAKWDKERKERIEAGEKA